MAAPSPARATRLLTLAGGAVAAVAVGLFAVRYPGAAPGAAAPDEFGKNPALTVRPAPPGQPTPVTHLFNGRDLDGFYTYRPPPPGKVGGKNYDPNRVFEVRGGLVHVAGGETMSLITEKEYGHYHLTVEYRWGESTGLRDEAIPFEFRGSGVGLHATGEDGSVFGQLAAFKVRVNMRTTGDLFLVVPNEKTYTLTVEAIPRDNPKLRDRLDYLPGAAPRTLTTGVVNHAGSSPDGKAVKNLKDRPSLEKPIGEWNTLECVCDDSLTVRLNGQRVNQVTNVRPSKGKIYIQSGPVEFWVRSIDLRPLPRK